MKVLVVQIATIRLEFPSWGPVYALPTGDDILKVNGVVVMLKPTLLAGQCLVFVDVQILLFTIELGNTKWRIRSKFAQSSKSRLPYRVGKQCRIRLGVSDVAENHRFKNTARIESGP